MDVVDDVFNASITAIYCFVFSTFATVEQRIRDLHPDSEQNGLLGLFSNNPMLRYKTSYGPITSPMGLLSLSTMSQSHYAYYPTRLSSTDYLMPNYPVDNNDELKTLTTEKKERRIKRMHRDAEKEEEQHLVM